MNRPMKSYKYFTRSEVVHNMRSRFNLRVEEKVRHAVRDAVTDTIKNRTSAHVLRNIKQCVGKELG